MGQEAGLTPMSAEGKAVELCGMISWESAAGTATKSKSAIFIGGKVQNQPIPPPHGVG